MCGIAGILSYSEQEHHHTIKAMTDAIAHRGPDGEGFWFHTESGVALGHRRLAIIDLSESADQPFSYLEERYVLVFNGEVYNYIELREDLRKKGYVFHTDSDTEVLACLFHDQRSDCLQLLDGMFAFAIWDREREELFCARDRFGEKPFFYCMHDGTFYFASEMKALWAAGVPRNPNDSRVFRLLAYNDMSDPNSPESTFFDGIFQLRPAHCMTYNRKGVSRQQRYWDIDLSKRSSLSYEAACAEFSRLFDLSVKRRMRSDVAIGSSLSGGLDSSSIVCTIRKVIGNTSEQHTFSARFEGFVRDEGYYIDQINERAMTTGHAVFLTESELESSMDTAAYFQEEPFGSSSILAQYHVMQLARKHKVTVLLDGQGADEYLAGYAPFFIDYFSSLRRPDSRAFKKQMDAYEQFTGNRINFGKFAAIDMRFPWLRNTLRNWKNKISLPPYLRQFDTNFLTKNKRISYRTPAHASLNESLYHATFQSSLPVLLRYADRNSMANSREVRLPFLFHELVEFVFSLPDDYKIRDCWTKAILRHSMAPLLPESVCWRKEKVGFEPPNNRQTDPEKVRQSIEKLIRNGVLNRENILQEKSWDYVQIARLYE